MEATAMSAFEMPQASDLVEQARQYFSQANPDAAGPNVGHNERLVSSLAGACLLAGGLSSHRKGSLLLAGLGGALLYRGMSGTCHLYKALGVNTHRRNPATVIPAQQGCKLEKTVIVNRPASELYSFWRELENLPKVMRHLKSVEAIDRVRSHWVAEGALGKEVQWDAEIFNDAENELIAWRSLPGGDVDTAGSVRFQPIGQHHGTAVTVTMKYDPPAGKVGAWVASLTGSGLEKKIEEDLARFKQLMEAEESLSVGKMGS
jgi:uncharacterized membrane protein